MPQFFYKDYALIETLEINGLPSEMPQSCVYCGHDLLRTYDQFTAYGHDIWYDLRLCARCGWWDMVYRNDMESGPHEEESYYQSLLRSSAQNESIEFAGTQLALELLKGKKNVYDLSPRQFEVVTRTILADHLDCEIELTKATRDGGKDLICMDSSQGQFIVEVKRYAESRKAGVSIVRDFIGAMFLDDIQTGYLVSSSGFSADAQEAAQMVNARSGWELHLHDSNDIASWLSLSFRVNLDEKTLNDVIGSLVCNVYKPWPVIPESWLQAQS